MAVCRRGTDLALALVAGGGSVWSVERLQRLVGVSRSGQPGSLAIRCRPLDHPRRAVNRWFRSELLPVVLLGGGLHVGLQIPASDDLRRGSVLRFGADSTDVGSAWQTGARRGCAPDRARSGGEPSPDAVGRDCQVRPTASGRSVRFTTMSRPDGSARGAAFRLRFAASRGWTVQNRAARAPPQLPADGRPVRVPGPVGPAPAAEAGARVHVSSSPAGRGRPAGPARPRCAARPLWRPR